MLRFDVITPDPIRYDSARRNGAVEAVAGVVALRVLDADSTGGRLTRDRYRSGRRTGGKASLELAPADKDSDFESELNDALRFSIEDTDDEASSLRLPEEITKQAALCAEAMKDIDLESTTTPNDTRENDAGSDVEAGAKDTELSDNDSYEESIEVESGGAHEVEASKPEDTENEATENMPNAQNTSNDDNGAKEDKKKPKK